MRGVKSEDRERCRPRRPAVYNVGGNVTARARALEGGPQDSVRKCEAGKKDRIAWLAIGSPPETPTNIVGSSQAGVLLILRIRTVQSACEKKGETRERSAECEPGSIVTWV